MVVQYITADELSDHMDGADLVESSANWAIKATGRWIKHCTGRRFWRDEEASARLYRPDTCDVAWVDDIATTDDLVIATDSGDGTYTTTWSATDYELEPSDADSDDDAYAWWRIRAVGDHAFPTNSRRSPLRVTAIWGWSEVPADVIQAALLVSAALYQRRSSALGVAHGGGDWGPIRVSRYADPDAVRLLDPYVRLDMMVA